MGYLVRLIVLASIFSGLSTVAQANEAAPPPRAPRSVDREAPLNDRAEAKRTPMVVTVEPGKPARLIIPRSLVAALAAEAPKEAAARPRSATIVSGLALSMAAVSLAFVFRRSKRASVVGAIVLLVSTSSLVFADIAPIRGKAKGPPAREPLVPVPVQAKGTLDIQVEVVEKGDAIQLIVDHPQRLILKAESKPTAAAPQPNAPAAAPQ